MLLYVEAVARLLTVMLVCVVTTGAVNDGPLFGCCFRGGQIPTPHRFQCPSSSWPSKQHTHKPSSCF